MRHSGSNVERHRNSREGKGGYDGHSSGHSSVFGKDGYGFENKKETSADNEFGDAGTGHGQSSTMYL